MSKQASELAGLRKQVKHECVVCHSEFEGIKQAKYCSNACRQKAKYGREKAKRTEDHASRRIEIAHAELQLEIRRVWLSVDWLSRTDEGKALLTKDDLKIFRIVSRHPTVLNLKAAMNLLGTDGEG